MTATARLAVATYARIALQSQIPGSLLRHLFPNKAYKMHIQVAAYRTALQYKNNLS